MLQYNTKYKINRDFQGGASGKESTCSAIDKRQFRSLDQEDSPGEGYSNQLQYSHLENPMDFHPEEPGGLRFMDSQSQTRLK